MAFEYVRSAERGLSFKEAEKANGNWSKCSSFTFFTKLDATSLECILSHFNIILIVLVILAFASRDQVNSFIMFTLVFTSVALQFCQEYNSSKAEMKLAELLKYPAKVQKCACRVIQTKLTVQVDLRDILPGYIVIFGMGDLCPGDVRLITSKNLIVRGVMDNKGNNRYSRRSNNSFARVKKHLFHGN